MMEKPLVDLKVLYYFAILAEEKHFGMAAKRIGIEQPPLSLQIKKLEKIIGAELFDRSSRQVNLTAAGETLWPEARKLLEQSTQAIEKVKSIGRGESGLLHIGFATSTIFSGITAAIQKHKKLYPKVELRLQELSSAAQVEALQTGIIDIGFIREPGKHEDIICKPVISEQFIAVLSSQHPLSRKKAIRFTDLAREPFVHFPRRVAPALYDKVGMMFHKAKFIPNIVQEAYEWQTIVSLVEANIGTSICPESFQKLKVGRVQYRPFTDISTETTISVCYHVSNSSKLITPFMNLVKDSL